MALTTIENLRAILPVGFVLTDEDANLAIDHASCVLAKAACNLSVDISTTVETYLSAHFVTKTDVATYVADSQSACSIATYTHGQALAIELQSSDFGKTAVLLCPGLSTIGEQATQSLEQAVRNILPSDTMLTQDNILVAIEAAHCVLARVTCNVSPECQTRVQTYLAAHFCTATERQLSVESEKSGCSNDSYSYGRSLGKGLQSSKFGQMAVLLCPALVSIDLTNPETASQSPIEAMAYSLGC